MDKQRLDQIAAALFLLWVVLLLPWIVLAPMAGMAFDAGPKFWVYVLVGSIWTYPISVGLVWMLRDDRPLISVLPLMNIALAFFSGCLV
jgi:hypothetical protein